MEILKDALLVEAENYLVANHDFSDWCMHCITEPSEQLEAAMQTVDIEDDEEFEDVLEVLILEAYGKARP